MRYFFLLCFIVYSCMVVGCVEDRNLRKYDKYTVPVEQLTSIDKVEFEEDPNQVADFVKVNPGEVNRLTLEDCRVLALQNNLDLKVQSYNPLLAKESLLSAHARFEPVLVAGVTYAANDYPSDYSESEDTSYYTRLQVPLVTGGNINFNLPLSKTETEGTYYYTDEITGQTRTFDSQSKYYNSSVRMQITQPLLRGAGVDVNTHNIRMSSYGLYRSLASSKLSTMSVLVSVDKAYWNLYYSQESLKVVEMDYELAKAQYERTSRMLELNQVKQIELLRAENTMTQKRIGIISARNQLRKSQRALKQILNAQGLEVESNAVVEAVSEPVAVKYKLDRTELLDYAMANRMELLDYELRLATQESTLEFNKNSLLPSLSLDYLYNFRAMGSSLSETMDMLGERELNDHRIGLTLSVPLGNRLAKSSYRSALLQMEQIKANKQLKELSITNDVLNAIETIESAWNSIVIADKSVDIALRTFEAEQRQYDLGMQNSTELLLARNNYASAMLQRLQAMVSYQTYMVDLCYQVGGLNQAARVEFNDAM